MRRSLRDPPARQDGGHRRADRNCRCRVLGALFRLRPDRTQPGRFSTPQLALTYVAESAIPLFVLGLYAAQRPQIGWLGLVSALTYAYTFVFFTSTVVYALIDHTRDWDALETQFGAWMTIHSVLMVVAGVAFGAAVARAHVLPLWTGVRRALPSEPSGQVRRTRACLWSVSGYPGGRQRLHRTDPFSGATHGNSTVSDGASTVHQISWPPERHEATVVWWRSGLSWPLKAANTTPQSCVV